MSVQMAIAVDVQAFAVCSSAIGQSPETPRIL